MSPTESAPEFYRGPDLMAPSRIEMVDGVHLDTVADRLRDAGIPLQRADILKVERHDRQITVFVNGAQVLEWSQ